jgi:hypothetical protein
MAVTVVEFRAYVGTDEVSSFIDECLTAGHALVTRFIGAATNVPVAVHDNAVLIASSELYYRRQSPQGVSQFAAFDGSPVRASKDPLTAVTPLLLPYLSYPV